MEQTDLTCTLKTEYQETHTKMNNKPLQSDYDIDLSQSIIESFAKFLVPEIRKYYENSIVKAEPV